MPDIWVDVDTAVIVPVNVLPLLDDTDFKTIEASVAYNQAGLVLTWNFVTAAGVQTGNAITPTTGGVFDWSEPLADVGMYAIELPASGQAAGSNNDREGVGWFTGVATGVLPWRGPTIGFRRAALNDLFMDGSTASTNLEDFFDGTGYVGGTAKLTVNTVQINGTSQTAGDVTADTAAILVDTSTTLETDLDAIIAAVITNAAGVDIAADIIAVKADTAAILTDTGTTLEADLDAIIAAVITNAAGVDIAADIIAVKADTAAILTDTGTTLEADLDAIIAATITNAAGVDIAADIIAVKADTAAILTDTGTTLEADLDAIIAAVITNAAGVDIAADIIAVKADTATILADTNELQTDDYPTSIAAVKADTAAILLDTAEIGAAGASLTALPWNATWDAEVQSEMDDALDTIVADSVPADGTRPTFEQALYMIWQFLAERTISGTTVTVKKADGSTSLMTFTLDSATDPTSITRAT